MNLPKDHQTVMPYLILPNADKFLSFCQAVFDATELAKYLTENGRIMHAEISIGGATIMLGESNEAWKPRPASLYIYSSDVDGTYEKALKNGAHSLMPVEDKSYGRACGVEDAFGNAWWITSYPK